MPETPEQFSYRMVLGNLSDQLDRLVRYLVPLQLRNSQWLVELNGLSIDDEMNARQASLDHTQAADDYRNAARQLSKLTIEVATRCLREASADVDEFPVDADLLDRHYPHAGSVSSPDLDLPHIGSAYRQYEQCAAAFVRQAQDSGVSALSSDAIRSLETGAEALFTAQVAVQCRLQIERTGSSSLQDALRDVSEGVLRRHVDVSGMRASHVNTGVPAVIAVALRTCEMLDDGAALRSQPDAATLAEFTNHADAAIRNHVLTVEQNGGVPPGAYSRFSAAPRSDDIHTPTATAPVFERPLRTYRRWARGLE
jgi:hypothetical protein